MDAADMAAFHRACMDLQQGSAEARAQAETMLMQMRQTPGAIGAAKGIIEQTEVPTAAFQAILILRDCLMRYASQKLRVRLLRCLVWRPGRDWNSTPLDHVESLRTEMLELTIGKWKTLQPFVRTQLLTLVALIVKRAYLDEHGSNIRSAFFVQAHTLIQGSDDTMQVRAWTGLSVSVMRCHNEHLRGVNHQ